MKTPGSKRPRKGKPIARKAPQSARQLKAKLAALRENARHETPEEQARADTVSNAMEYAGLMTRISRKGE